MYVIVGFKFMNFKDDNGKDVIGYKLHLLSDADDPELDEGQSVISKFFSTRLISGTPKVGANCEFKITMSGSTPKIAGLVIHEN